MKVTKGTIDNQPIMTLELDEDDKDNGALSVIQNEALFWADITFCGSMMDGWNYFYDANQNLVYPLNDYGYDLIDELIDKGTVTMYGRPNDGDYEGFEWNEGLLWVNGAWIDETEDVLDGCYN